jgi:hypothetical protein
MVRIRIGSILLLVCTLLLHASYTYADDDFGDGSDPEPTGPVITVAPNSSTTPLPTTARNRVPVADAGPSLTVSTGALVVLDGAASKDPDGNIISYSWRQLSGPKVELLSSRTPHPSFSSGNISASYIFQLTVRDSKGASAVDVVTIVVKARPVVSALPTILPTLPPTSTPTLAQSSQFPFIGILITALGGILMLLVGTFVKVMIKDRIPPVSGVLQDAITHAPLHSVDIQFFDQGTKNLVGTYATDDQGQFVAAPPPGVYIVSAKKQGYGVVARENVVVPITKELPISLTIDMMPLVP